MSYTINFSDPLKPTFIVNTGDFNGPGGNTANSSLRIYGRSTLEWGEAVNENQLRLTEHWAGATPPPFPIEGQLWYEQQLYILQPGTAWWRWNFTGQIWEDITINVHGNTVGSNTPPLTPSDGDYWYTGSTPSLPGIQPNTLYRYDSLYRQIPSSWLKRISGTSTTPPNAPPVSRLLVWTGTEWRANTNIFTSSSQPENPTVGDLWFDVSGAPVNVLRVYDGTVWEIVNQNKFDQRYVNITGDTMNGVLNMGNNNIINVVDPVNNQDAATKAYVDSGDTTKVSKSGDTMNGVLNMGNNNIINVVDPVNNQDAATKAYVDAATASVTVFPTGAILDYLGTTAPTGWLLLNGNTIGNTGSGATFAGALYQNLYNLLWNLSQELAPVSGGRGVSAAADWTANKTLGLPNAGQRTFIGAGSAAGQFDNFTDTAVNITNERITVPSNVDKWITGMPVVFNVISGTSPAPLVDSTTYWIIRISATEIQLASSLANAQNQNPINLTTAGSGTFRVTYTPSGTRAFGTIGGESSHAQNINELLAHNHSFGALNTGAGALGTGNIVASNTGTTGGNVAMNIMQPYIVTNKIIKI
jgi:hypothetical protein